MPNTAKDRWGPLFGPVGRTAHGYMRARSNARCSLLAVSVWIKAGAAGGGDNLGRPLEPSRSLALCGAACGLVLPSFVDRRPPRNSRIFCACIDRGTERRTAERKCNRPTLPNYNATKVEGTQHCCKSGSCMWCKRGYAVRTDTYWRKAFRHVMEVIRESPRR